MKLTDIVLRNLAVPAQGQKTYQDDSLPGFGVRVSPGGTKTFVVVYGYSRERRSIGRYPVISLADARVEAKRMFAEVTLGQHRPKRIPFEQALETFVSTHCAQKNRPRTARDTERLIRNHFAPKLARKSLDEVTTRDISSVTDKLIAAGKPGAANHAFAAVRTFLRWSVRRRHINHSPIEGLELPAKAGSRERVLTDEELAEVLTQAKLNGTFGLYMQLLILTGQRRTEIASLHAEMIDYGQRTITLPKWLCKNNRDHAFPFEDMVAGILDGLPKEGLLFPARGNLEKPFSGFSAAKIAFDKECPVEPWTLHDLRRTFATGLQRLGIRIEVTEALLNHVSGTRAGIVAVYQRHNYIQEMREAAALWEKHIDSLTKPGYHAPVPGTQPGAVAMAP
jgi:integrase